MNDIQKPSLEGQETLELSSFIAAMDKAFGDTKVQAPWHIWQLRLEHAPVLKGMAAGYSHWLYSNPYQALLEALQQEPMGVDVTIPPKADFAVWAAGYTMCRWPK